LTRKPAAPARTRGTVNAYWIEKREARLKRQASRPKRQAASNKLDKPIDLWDKVI
jgi:hypothetical protein